MNRILYLCLGALLVATCPARGAESWGPALASMPLGTNRIHFSKGEPARAILHAFRSNDWVKAIVIMPGATDELYFNDRGTCQFAEPTTLLEAVHELTNRTSIRATFHPPFLLLAGSTDYNSPLLNSTGSLEFSALRSKRFTRDWVMIDKEWDQLYPTLNKNLGLKLSPALGSPDAWHFYRVYFAAFNLNDLEAVELVSLATQTEAQADGRRLTFRRRPPASAQK